MRRLLRALLLGVALLVTSAAGLAAYLSWASLPQLDGRLAVPGLAAEAQRMRDAAADPDTKGTLLVVESCLRQTIDDNQAAYELALQAVQQDATADDGLNCARIDQLMTTSSGLPREVAVTRFAQAWAPDSSHAWHSAQHVFESSPTGLANLERETALAAIQVSLAPDAAAQPILDDDWRPGETFRQAVGILVGVLQGLADVAIFAAVFLLPLGALVGVAVLAAARLRARRAAPRLTA